MKAARRPLDAGAVALIADSLQTTIQPGSVVVTNGSGTSTLEAAHLLLDEGGGMTNSLTGEQILMSNGADTTTIEAGEATVANGSDNVHITTNEVRVTTGSGLLRRLLMFLGLEDHCSQVGNVCGVAGDMILNEVLAVVGQPRYSVAGCSHELKRLPVRMPKHSEDSFVGFMSCLN